MDSQQEVQTHVFRLKAVEKHYQVIQILNPAKKEIEILVNRLEIDINTYSR